MSWAEAIAAAIRNIAQSVATQFEGPDVAGQKCEQQQCGSDELSHGVDSIPLEKKFEFLVAGTFSLQSCPKCAQRIARVLLPVGEGLPEGSDEGRSFALTRRFAAPSPRVYGPDT